MCLREQSGAQGEPAGACIGPPFQRSTRSHNFALGFCKEVNPSGPGWETRCRQVGKTSVAREACGSESVCDRRWDGSVKRVKLLSLGVSCGWTK